MGKYATTEHSEQAAFISHCRWKAQSDPRYGLVFANVNAGKRSIGALRYYLAEGLSPGVPDITVACPSGGFPGMFIEMKTEKGKVSAYQEEWLRKLHGAGYRVAVCRSAQEAIRELTRYFDNNKEQNEK